MSGICGVINIMGKPVVKQAIRSMCASMDTRSDEKQKALVNGNVGLGVTNISPPAAYSDAEMFVIATGAKFTKATGSITEEIIVLYRNYGDDCPNHIEGQFNFCIWERKREKLLIATDRFGTIPLNYYFDGEKFIFGSKIRAITQCIKPNIDKAAIYNYLNFMCVPTPQTVYEGIKKLPPGHLLILHNNRIVIKRYWDVNYQKVRVRSEKYYAKRLFSSIENSVQKCINLCPDKSNIGAFLSGGLDSSVVCGMMTRALGKGVKAFSIGFEEKTYSELSYARIAAKHFGLKHYEYIITPQDALNAFKALVKEYSEPYGNTSAIAAYYCMKLAKDNGVDVLLGGDGGDENFAGYSRYVTNKIFLLYHYIPWSLRKYLIEPGIQFLPIKRIKNYIQHSNIPDPERLFIYNFYPMYNRNDIFSEDFLHSLNCEAPLNIVNNLFNSAGTKDILNGLLYVDTKLGLIDNDLRGKIENISQLLGIQVLYPLLNTGLWELGAEIPSNLKIKGFNKKYIYKKAFKGFLPAAIIEKRKHGFGLPYAIWLRTDKDIRNFTKEVLLDPSIYKRGYFKRGIFEKLIAANDKEPSSYYGDLLSVFLMLELWRREHKT